MATRTKADVEAAAEARQEKLTALSEGLVSAVKDLTDSDAWKAAMQTFVDLRRNMHSYSLTNAFLLWSQKPDVSMVASYTKWKDLGRQVRKGERSLYVFGPIIVKVGDDEELRKGDFQDPKGQWRRLVGFRPLPVFDISQTEGPPVGSETLTEYVQGPFPEEVERAVQQLVADEGWDLRYDEAPILGDPGINGVTVWMQNTDERFIQIRSDRPPAQQFKTLLHEAGHMRAHDPDAEVESEEERAPHRGAKEVEAESIAFLTAAHYGLDTSSYSLGYLAGWAAGNPERVVDRLPTINKHVNWLIDQIDKRLPEVGEANLDALGAQLTDIQVNNTMSIGV